MRQKSMKFINRELSWLEFNQRVLNEALDSANPLLERLKFLSIVSSNLDEFFMVRVGGLDLLVRDGLHKKDIAGMTPLQQLRAIATRAHSMVEEQYRCYLDELEPAMHNVGIQRVQPCNFTKAQHSFAEQYFDRELFPTLSPVALRSEHRFPLLVDSQLAVVCRIKNAPREPQKYALIPVSKNMPRFIPLPSQSGFVFVLIEDLIKHFIHSIFPQQHILETCVTRITRNADMSVREDMASDLLVQMKEVLSQRKRSDAVRLEIATNATRTLCTHLRRLLALEARDIYHIPGPLNLSAFMQLAFMDGFEESKNEPWPPQPTPALDAASSMFEVLSKKDVLLHHPYEHFDPVVRLIQEAARDPDVLAIKQILYRTSKNSPIIEALREAAHRGKYVTALVELKARFDEAQNIGWAEKLEEDGVQVVYGVRGLKTHAKLLLIVRKEPQGIMRYMHFGTGNYNEKTARIYTDISYMTCDEDLAADASSFFNAITGFSQPQEYRKIAAAPLTLKERIITHIEEEVERKKQGQKALIMAKVNSLADPEVIEALYKASRAGVEIRLNVRGICCLRPGIKRQSENIQVVSVIDRFLEHSRILYFHHGGSPKVYISSADWMPRNLDKRVELMTPVEEPNCQKKLIDILKAYFKDRRKAWVLLPNDTYMRNIAPKKRRQLSSQEYFHQEAVRTIKDRNRLQGTFFEAHRPQES